MSQVLEASRTNPREGGASFPLRHRAFRALWNVTWALLASWTPPPLHGWRRFLLRLFGAKLAPTARVYGGARVWYPPNLEMGAHSVLAARANCYCMDRVSIGAYAVVSQGAQLCGGTHLIDDAHFQLITKPIVIGANAWIAAEAFVGPGVVVGEGAVLGARGVAFSDLEAWGVYAGNPAKWLRKRNDTVTGGAGAFAPEP
ncbi:putative colanic acid biosynthesis acetyltransferase [Devosia sp. 2618]|uniref:putative colanic acid biosynthesis acetyltransferase n=1 Tax=Devosia sp. 2618 TaxID=3156454 RepID=UPI003390A4BE